VLGTSAALGLVRFRFFGREAVETFFLAPLLVPEILLGAALYLFYARLAIQASIWTLLWGHLVICTPYVIRSVTAVLVGLDRRLVVANRHHWYVGPYRAAHVPPAPRRMRERLCVIPQGRTLTRATWLSR